MKRLAPFLAAFGAAALLSAGTSPEVRKATPTPTPKPSPSPSSAPAAAATAAARAVEKWIPMFNGKDLEGWTPKFAGSRAGENVLRTFRVEDGILSASYADYDEMKGRFGHLFYHRKLSHYRIRLEYRFV